MSGFAAVSAAPFLFCPKERKLPRGRSLEAELKKDETGPSKVTKAKIKKAASRHSPEKGMFRHVGKLCPKDWEIGRQKGKRAKKASIGLIVGS